MDSLLIFFIWVSLMICAFLYYRFALLDHRYPDKLPSKWSCLFSALLVSVITTLIFGAREVSPEFAEHLSMISLGMITAPAIAPPLFVDKRVYFTLRSRLKIKLKDRLSAIMLKKIISCIIGIFVLNIFDIEWHEAVYICCAFLLLAKAASMANIESGGAKDNLKREMVIKWAKRYYLATITFGLLWYVGPDGTFKGSQSMPSSLAAITGLGLGSLFLGFED